jgi:hypothetical protein
MFRSLTRSAGIALAITALGASTAAAAPADLRTPDAVAAGQSSVVQSTPTDVRTPDARDAAVPATTTTGTDLRTPDARDHGEGRGTFSAPDVTVVKVTEPPVATGFDWGDAGIGAGGLLGIVLIALGGMLAITHRRHGRMPLAG